MRVLMPLVFVLCACGRLSFERETEHDAGAPDAGAEDAGTAYASGPFDAPVLVAELSSTFEEDDPSLTADLLEIYFKTDREGDNDIYASTRGSVDDPWSAPTRVNELCTTSAEDTPEVSFDGLTMHLASDRAGSGMEIYRSTRTSRSDAWGEPVLVEELSSDLDDFAAVMDDASLALVMTRLDGGADLFVAHRATAAEPWTAPVPIEELNTRGHEADAVLDARGLLLFYTGVRADGTGGRELLLAARPTVDAPFEARPPVDELNTDDNEEDPWISPDLSVIYFSRQTAGERNIYRASRPL